ncbi:hypothetical protein HK104_000182 [Borealophlyctis nickersoniae]|nr:hypothetical protein HK104_000182 [Borealophlyctis nickersoniae]
MATVEIKTLAWGMLYLFLLIVGSIFTGAIADQARYGPSRVCLLYIKDYKLENDNTYSFDAKSPACGYVVGMGAVGIILAAVLGAAALWFQIKGELRARRVILVYAATSTLYTFLVFVAACIATVGIKTTCEQLEAPQKNIDCATIFAHGFFLDDTSKNYGKNLATVYAGVSASWLLVMSWAAYSAFEFWNWKRSVQRWW